MSKNKPGPGRVSRFLSLILRHNPDAIGITLDVNGWANVGEILKGVGITMETLETVVNENNKQRFTFNSDKTKIRANRGHHREEI